VGGVPDVVRSGEGLLVPTESPAALAEAIGHVRADPAGAESRAAAAEAALGTRFSPERWLERYDAIYHALTGA
jgi:glycosyltransferase involved in cell wall biosynthesis